MDHMILPPPTEPTKVARKLVARFFTRDGVLVLRHWRGGWWEWRTSRWIERESRAVRAQAYHITEHALCTNRTRIPDPDERQKQKPDKKSRALWEQLERDLGERFQQIIDEVAEELGVQGDDPDEVLRNILDQVPIAWWEPNRNKIANLLEALMARCHLDETVNQPAWIDVPNTGALIVSCANGLLNVTNRTLHPHTPQFFNQTAVPFNFDPTAPAPERWLAFLNELWPDDADSIAALQEWFGYVISGRLDLHKILLLVGPTRAGKGVIARILGALVGEANVAAPTLNSLHGEFGLRPLIGKPLAVISDARLNGKQSSVVVERLLSVSGEDTITVNIKYQDQWTGKLPSRFMVLSNELPQLGDASTAIAGRFVPLLLSQSWLGKEDHRLERALRAELPGILNWALDGLERLNEQHQFTRPASTDETITALQDLASPVAAFLRDRCETGPEHQVPIDDLYAAWVEWCENNGQPKKSKTVLGRDIRAARPLVRVIQPGSGGNRPRFYVGIGLKG
jgi:putative DNA primase/helicase